MVPPHRRRLHAWRPWAAALALLALASAADAELGRAQTAPAASYEGPKARLAVLRFDVRPPTATAVMGDGVAEMLADGLARTNRYAVGGQAPAELMVIGVLTELTLPSGAPGAAAQVAFEVRLLDAKTSRVLGSGMARARAADVTGLTGDDQPRLGAGLAPYAGTPVEKALRQALQSGVRTLVAATPAEYLRHVEAAARPAALEAPAPLPPLTVTPAEGPRPTAPAAPTPAPTAPPAQPPATAKALGMRFVRTPTANLRDGGSTTGRILQSVPRGTRLELLETRAGWHRVRLPDGKEGWLADSVTSATPP